MFFCGAGISRPAGLPGFEGLVKQIYKDIGTHWEPVEEEAFKRAQFDATLDLLERRIVGQRERVRTALAKVLKPKLRKKGATHTHAALLELSQDRDGSTRLVTTNFDRIFHRLMKKTKVTASSYVAPFLPVPKDSRWNGVVYLHGLLPETEDQSALARLVLTSGDFGLAYLVERWAARFVSELFRNYIVCFVGYSINDPVLRYMMDALAADRMLGETTPQAYAFGDFSADEESKKKTEWESKGVIPILYEVQKKDDHSLLSRTLQAWAATYRDGVQGRESIVSQYALTRPAGSTKQDDFVGRMLWAITHPSGLPAKRFANFVPAPSLDWLEPLFEDRFSRSDLRRFRVSPNEQQDEGLEFSVLRRPAPYTHAPRMALVSAAHPTSNWDHLMEQLAYWLLRYLNDPALVLSLVKKGDRLHHSFAWLIERRLHEIYELEKAGKTEELDRIRTESPECIPSPLMRIVWRLLLTGRVKTYSRELDIFSWERRFEREGYTTTLRLELRALLTPKVSLNKPFRWGQELDEKGAPERLKELFRWEIEPTAEHVRHCLEKLSKIPHWVSALPSLLADFQHLLMDALDLTQELCTGESEYDSSYLDLPSISEHWQNRGYRDWVILIELLRDAWIVTMEKDLQKAQQLARNWISVPHPTFKRLALFSATYDGIIPPEEWAEWLLSNNCEWLWTRQTKREVMRLLVLQGRNLSEVKQAQLEQAILSGPPQELSRDDLDPKRYALISSEMVWQRLAKLDLSGLSLGPDALGKLRIISAANPTWKLDGEQLDEFVVVMSGTGDPNYETQREIERAPIQKEKLVKWLQKPKPDNVFYEDDWREVCRTEFELAIDALLALAQENIWPRDRWSHALQIWSDEKLVSDSWQRVSQLLRCMPDPDLTSIASSVTFWLEQFSKQGKHEWQSFPELCKRILSLPIATSNDTDRPLIRAINHPVGHVTQAILNQWFLSNPGDGDKLPAEIEKVFTELCTHEVPQNRHGWVILANNVISLFRIDRDWATKQLLCKRRPKSAAVPVEK